MQSKCLIALQGVAITIEYLISGESNYKLCDYLTVEAKFLVSYHETHKNEIEKHFSAARTTWPEAWQMSWAIRNVTSHSGTVFKHINQKPIS